MDKKLIIICLVIVLIYLAYQQNNQSSIIFASANQENQEQLTKLQQELQHHQSLYQKRVEKDLTGQTSYAEYQEMEQQNKDEDKLQPIKDKN